MTTFEQFAFQTPLYSKVSFPDDMILKITLLGHASIRVDGHCSSCGKPSTFCFDSRDELNVELHHIRKHVVERQHVGSFKITCSRDSTHELRIWFIMLRDTVEKVGQYPSLADIANDEAATYRSVLNKVDASELHKAIGLAAHGVGVGSFVYLRRLFERLIYARFAEFQKVEGWSEDDFLKLKMDDKVKFLKGHIPDFLYENRRMYSILSKGIHELSEEHCLKFFEPLKLSIKLILEEDKKKKEELALRQMAADAIKAFEK